MVERKEPLAGRGGGRSDPRRGRSWSPKVLALLMLLAVLVLLPPTGGALPGGGSGSHVPAMPRGGTAAGASTTLLASPAAVRSPGPAPRTGAVGAALSSALNDVVRQALTSFLRPHAGIGLPNITSTNITGFLASPVGESVTGNSGLTLSSAIGPMPTGANSTTYVFSILGQAVSANSTAFVGYLEGSFPVLGSAADPLYMVLNGTSIATCGFGGLSNILRQGTMVDHFVMQESNGPWWTFKANGQVITGGSSLLGSGICPGNGNGTVDLYADSTTILTTPLYAWIIPGNVSGVQNASVALVCEYDSGGTWTQSQIGLLVEDLLVGVAGYDQDPTIPPDSLNMSEALPVLTPLTELWGTGALPTLALAERGLPSPPSTVPMGSSVPFTVWSNDSSTGAGVGPSTIVATSSLNATFVPTGSGPSVGEFHYDYVAPLLTSGATDEVTLLAEDTPNYVAASRTFPIDLVQAPLNVTARAPPGPVASDATVIVPLWVNVSGSGPASSSSVVLHYPTVSGGGNVTIAPGGGTPPGTYALLFRAPSFAQPSLSKITVVASGTTYLPGSVQVWVRVEPRPLELAPPSSLGVSAGAAVRSFVALSTPLGSLPLPSAVVWNLSYSNLSGAALVGAPGVTPDAGGAVVTAVLQPTFVGPIAFVATAWAPGFNGSLVGTWWVNATGNLTVSLTGAPSSLESGSASTLIVTVVGAGGAPGAEALVAWTANVGGFEPGGQASATSYTTSQGSSSVEYQFPTVATTEVIAFSVEVSETYYNTAWVHANTTLNGTNSLSGGTLTTASQILAPVDVFLVVIFCLLLLVLYAETRARKEAGSKAGTGGGGRGGKWAPPAEDEEAPWAGAPTGVDVEEEVGESDHPSSADEGSKEEPDRPSPAEANEKSPARSTAMTPRKSFPTYAKQAASSAAEATKDASPSESD